MGDTLEALLRLQVVETKLAALRRQRESKVRRLEYHKRQVKQADDRLAKERDVRRERQTKLDLLTLDVNAHEESINKHREALNRAKTNKEYGAILAAMNTEKADNSKRESGILEFMDEIQKIQAEAEQVEEGRAKLLTDLQASEQTLTEFDAETQPELDSLTDTRAQYADEIAPSILSAFSRVAVHHDGEAMASIIKVHPKRQDHACSGCNMTVSLEVVSTLSVRDEIQLCKTCGRILYLEIPATTAKRGK